MIADGRIADAKTIMLLQYAALNIFTRASTRVGKGALRAVPPLFPRQNLVARFALPPDDLNIFGERGSAR